MTVNGRNPSTNPHLSSWITDIINRRYSSISPVFPIQRWGAGLFPSLSADLMTFTKLLYACVYILNIYIHICTHTRRARCLWVCVSARMCLMFVRGNICANLMLSVCIPVILQINLVWVDSLVFLSDLCLFFFFICSYLCCQPCSSITIHRGAVQQFAAAVDLERKWNKSGDKSGKPAHMKKR